MVGIITLGDVRGAEPSSATSLSIWEMNYLPYTKWVGAEVTNVIWNRCILPLPRLPYGSYSAGVEE